MKKEDRELWTDRINDYRTSGLTAVKWADENNISVHRLRYYINKFNKENKQKLNQKPHEIKWASVVPETPVLENKHSGLLKVTVGKATIEVFPGFDENTFKSIVRILT